MVSIRMLTLMATLWSGFALANTEAHAEKDCSPGGEVSAPVGGLLEVANKMTEKKCPDASKLRRLCSSISNKWDAPKESEYSFEFEIIIMEAACAKPTESEEVIATKVRSMWEVMEKDKYALTCDGPDFSVGRGNVLKYAVTHYTGQFLYEAAETWKVNLNKIDYTDNKTVLDFIQDQIDRFKGHSREKQLKSYYDLLRKKGAKHRKELP